MWSEWDAPSGKSIIFANLTRDYVLPMSEGRVSLYPSKGVIVYFDRKWIKSVRPVFFNAADSEQFAMALAKKSGKPADISQQDVEKLLDAKALPISPKEMIGFRRVRSIQIARDGIFSYPYFNCRFKEISGKIFFEKTKGSQRKSGFLYQNSPESLIFLGGWSVNDEPQTAYGSENSVAGTVYKIGTNKAIMIFPTEKNRVEIYEFIK